MPQPVAVLRVSTAGNDVKLIYLVTGAQTAQIVEHDLDGTSRSRSVPARASTVDVGPLMSGTPRPATFELIARGYFGREARDAASAIIPVTAPPARDMLSTVRTYYAYWNDKKFSQLWALLLSPKFTERHDYNQWLQDHNYDTPIDVTCARVIGDDKVAATVLAGGKTKYFVIWTLIKDNASWLLDDVQYTPDGEC